MVRVYHWPQNFKAFPAKADMHSGECVEEGVGKGVQPTHFDIHSSKNEHKYTIHFTFSCWTQVLNYIHISTQHYQILSCSTWSGSLTPEICSWNTSVRVAEMSARGSLHNPWHSKVLEENVAYILPIHYCIEKAYICIARSLQVEGMLVSGCTSGPHIFKGLKIFIPPAYNYLFNWLWSSLIHAFSPLDDFKFFKKHLSKTFT